ncbi:MAG: pyridoxal phosphate-dependent aminotransferase [Phycisphaerae bacterium]
MKPLGASGIRRVFDLSATLTDPINLSIGQPDYPVPANVKEAMRRAIDDDQTGYTVTRGLPRLRERIAAELKEEFAWAPDLLVTCGVSGGLFLALAACINPGDEVLIGDPYFVSYKHLVKLVGGVPVMVDLYDDFHVHPERFAERVTAKTKMILICSPGNPTGVVYPDDELRGLCELAADLDLLIVSDEIYRTLSYDGPAASPVTHARERTLLLRGFSKSHALTGLRLGYAAGPAEIISEMAKLQQYTFVCAPHPAQYGALAAMDTDMSDRVAEYRGKRDLVCRELEGVFDFVRPGGGFYVFPKVPAGFASASAFAEKAVSRNVLIIPGEAFSERDSHFRISYAASDETIRRGCEILRELAG